MREFLPWQRDYNTQREKERLWVLSIYIERGNVPKREGFLFLFAFEFYFDTFFFLILILMCVFLILQSTHISTLIYCPPRLQAFTIILILIFFLVLVYLFHSSTYFLLFCLIIFHSTLSFNQNSVLSSFDGYTFVKK